jgi:hypothetical protein
VQVTTGLTCGGVFEKQALRKLKHPIACGWFGLTTSLAIGVLAAPHASLVQLTHPNMIIE